RELQCAPRAGEPRRGRLGPDEPRGARTAPGRARALARGANQARGRPGACAPGGRAPARGSRAAQADRPPAGEAQVTQKVLVMDQDPPTLEALEMRRPAMAFDVTAPSDPRKALEAVEAGRFDLALLDLRMEPLDGMRVMEALHERQPRLPVLI